MGTALSAAELAAVQDACRTLASPFGPAGVRTDWPALAAESIKSAIGAKNAAWFSTESLKKPPVLEYTTHPPELQRTYMEEFLPADYVTRRMLMRGLRVAHMYDVSTRREYEESLLRKAFAGPNRIFDPVALRTDIGESATAWISFQFDRANSDDADVRSRLVKLELIWPTFASAVAVRHMLGRQIAALGRLLDHLPSPAAIGDASGRLLYRNVAFSMLLSRQSDQRGLVEACDSAMKQTAQLLTRRQKSNAAPPVPAPAVEVRTHVRHYLVRCCIVEEALLPSEPAIVVTIIEGQMPLPDCETLVKRLGLTTREAEVALLLARRKRNREIAEALSISPHTCERHTERVLLKLGVNSRDEVAAKLTGSEESRYRRS